MITKKQVEQQLSLVLDPELGVNIVDLGLVYEVSVENDNINVLMTLTFPGCPLGGIINSEVQEKLGKLKGVGKINLQITFDPPWDLSKIKPEVAAELGMVR